MKANHVWMVEIFRGNKWMPLLDTAEKTKQEAAENLAYRKRCFVKANYRLRKYTSESRACGT